MKQLFLNLLLVFGNAADCNPAVVFPVELGMNKTGFGELYDSSISNFLVLPSTFQTVVAVESMSLMYFNGGAEHGTEGPYHGLLLVAATSETYQFKKGYLSNQAVMKNLHPAIMALNPAEDSLAVLYADTSHSLVLDSGLNNRMIVRWISLADGKIERGLGIDKDFGRSHNLMDLRNTIGYYDGLSFIFVLNFQENPGGEYHAFLSIDRTGSTHIKTSYRGQSNGSHFYYLRHFKGSGTYAITDHFLLFGPAHYLQGSSDFLVIVKNERSGATPYSIQNSFHDQVTHTVFMGDGSTPMTPLEGVGLITKPDAANGQIQVFTIVQARCDRGSSPDFTVTCSNSKAATVAEQYTAVGCYYVFQSNSVTGAFTRQSTNDFIGIAPPSHPTLGALTRMDILDGTFLTTSLSDYSALWIVYFPTERVIGTLSLEKSGSVQILWKFPMLSSQPDWLTTMGLQLVTNLNVNYFHSRSSHFDGSANEVYFFAFNSDTGKSGMLFPFRNGNGISCESFDMDSLTLVTGTHSSPSSTIYLSSEINSLTASGSYTYPTQDNPVVANGAFSTETSSAATEDIPSPQRVHNLGDNTDITYCKTKNPSCTDTQLSALTSGGDWGIPGAVNRYILPDENKYVQFITVTALASDATKAVLHMPPLECSAGCDRSGTCGYRDVVEQLGTLSFEDYFKHSGASRLSLDSSERQFHRLVASHPLDLSHFSFVNVASSVGLSGLIADFQTKYRNQIVGLEILPQGISSYSDLDCQDPAKFGQPFLPLATTTIADFRNAPYMFLTVSGSKFNIKSAVHLAPLECHAIDHEVWIKDQTASWVQVQTSLTPQAYAGDYLQAGKLFGEPEKVLPTYDPPGANDTLLWILNNPEVNVPLRAEVESSGSGLVLSTFISKFTKDATKFFTGTVAAAMNHFRAVDIQLRPIVRGQAVTTIDQELHLIICGDPSRPLYPLSSSLFSASADFAANPHGTSAKIFRLDFTSVTSISISSSGHQFCSSANCGAHANICQDPSETGLSHSYEIEYLSGESWVASSASAVLVYHSGNTTNQRVWTIPYEPSLKYEKVGPVQTWIRLVSGFTSPQAGDEFTFEMWYCSNRWFTSGSSSQSYTYPSTLPLQYQTKKAQTQIFSIPALPTTIKSQEELSFALQESPSESISSASLTKAKGSTIIALTLKLL